MSDKNEKRKDYVAIFSSEEGNRVLINLMDLFHMSTSSHVEGAATETAFREGERHVVLHILHMLGKRNDPQWLNSSLDESKIQYETPVFHHE